MKFLLISILSLFSGYALAHPGHAEGDIHGGQLPVEYLVVLVVIVVVARILYNLGKRRDSE